jgi:hypothetical protein
MPGAFRGCGRSRGITSIFIEPGNPTSG